MINEKEMLDIVKMTIDDETVFSSDQIAILKVFADEIDQYINIKIQNFNDRNV